MLDIMTQPLGIYIVALGVGFILPLIFRANQGLATTAFLLGLAYLGFNAAYNLLALMSGAATINIQTAGIAEPFAINLHMGLLEAGAVLAVNVAALFGAWNYLDKLKQQASAMLIYLLLVMGINGMIMTRDLFNLFIFIEITSIATYAMIGMERSSAVLAAGFKYIIATAIASAFFLLGTIFIYHQTGTLNIDDIIAHSSLIQGPIGLIALSFLFTSLLIELKPYPANGWGLDVYETTPGSVASLISVGVSTAVLFALYKILPLMTEFLTILVWVGGLTFLFSNIIGLKQDHSKRLLGYSSIGQIGLLVMALALVTEWHADSQLIIIVGGLFINHLFAKAGLFWLADYTKSQSFSDWQSIAKKPLALFVFAVLLAALVGLPPFPGFWAKWQLVMLSASHDAYGWIGLILLGSLLEAAYLFRWFTQSRTAETDADVKLINLSQLMMPLLSTVALAAIGYWMADSLSHNAQTLFIPLLAGLIVWLADSLAGKFKVILMILLVAIGSYQLIVNLEGLYLGFGLLLVAGGLLVSLAALSNQESRKGYYPLLTILLLSLASIVSAKDSLSFFYGWELMTLSSYFLITFGNKGAQAGLKYLLFSLGSAYFIFTGFAISFAATGSQLLNSMGSQTTHLELTFAFLAIGFLIKIAGFGFHVWLPDAYGEADDDLTALLSSVISKASIFGLIVIAAHLGSQVTEQSYVAYILAWLGVLTALFGALFAVFQEDIKKLVAYSSMSQLGYIVVGIAMMSHLGWVSALYSTVNHFMFKAILFLSIAGIIMRTNQRMMYKMGGLIKNMPITFFASMIAIIAMSGVPPLTGYGSKWMMFNAMMDKGWFWIAAIAFFSSAVAFLYMFRYLHTVFLGQRKLEHHEIKEAPLFILIPQIVLVIAILAFSAYPKWLLLPISEMITPIIGGALTWEGQALVTGIGQWNAPMIMMVVGGVWVVPLLLLLLASSKLNIQKVEQFNIVYAAERPSRPEHTHYAHNFFAHYRRSLGFLVEPRATAFWNSMVEWTHSIAASFRVFYTGNGQTYALFILIYFIAVFMVIGGLSL